MANARQLYKRMGGNIDAPLAQFDPMELIRAIAGGLMGPPGGRTTDNVNPYGGYDMGSPEQPALRTYGEGRYGPPIDDLPVIPEGDVEVREGTRSWMEQGGRPTGEPVDAEIIDIDPGSMMHEDGGPPGSEGMYDSPMDEPATPDEITALGDADAPEDQTYVIKKGDTLWDIAERELGDGRMYKQLAQMNGIPNPDRIRAGVTIMIPKGMRKPRMRGAGRVAEDEVYEDDEV